MGRATRRKQIIIPNDYWESSTGPLGVKWVYINA